MNLNLTPIKNEDRNGDLTLTKEAVEAKTREIEKYLEKTGYANIGEIAKQLNVQWETAKRLVGLVIDKWRKDDIDARIIQKHWYQNIVSELVENPERFDKRPREQIEFRAWLFSKINEIDKQMGIVPAEQDESIINYDIWGKFSPKTLDYIKSQRDAERQEEIISNDNQSAEGNGKSALFAKNPPI